MANGNGNPGEECIPFDVVGIWECLCCERDEVVIAEVNRINQEFVDAGKFNINYGDIRPRVGRNRWFLKAKN